MEYELIDGNVLTADMLRRTAERYRSDPWRGCIRNEEVYARDKVLRPLWDADDSGMATVARSSIPASYADEAERYREERKLMSVSDVYCESVQNEIARWGYWSTLPEVASAPGWRGRSEEIASRGLGPGAESEADLVPIRFRLPASCATAAEELCRLHGMSLEGFYRMAVERQLTRWGSLQSAPDDPHERTIERTKRAFFMWASAGLALASALLATASL